MDLNVCASRFKAKKRGKAHLFKMESLPLNEIYMGTFKILKCTCDLKNLISNVETTFE